ncbi:hypothetical protein EUGRSUZ_I02448 [Eucalyptus grandis]|uniref:Uncharacterized protein n=6 Tax=Eucalyptus grandis TaxID=71139 RepID=A0ACC3JI46_EUCGR|nr:hypothetical protein EUGRSUZ_I02448 [Eucalyptus grandis]
MMQRKRYRSFKLEHALHLFHHEMGKDQLTGYVFLKICNLACYSSVIQINGFLSIQILETLFCSYKHAAHRNGNHFMLDLPLSNVNAASINCSSQKT